MKRFKNTKPCSSNAHFTLLLGALAFSVALTGMMGIYIVESTIADANVKTFSLLARTPFSAITNKHVEDGAVKTSLVVPPVSIVKTSLTIK